MESFDVDGSILMLQKAAKTVETENRPFQAACYISRLFRYGSVENINLEEYSKTFYFNYVCYDKITRHILGLLSKEMSEKRIV